MRAGRCQAIGATGHISQFVFYLTYPSDIKRRSGPSRSLAFPRMSSVQATHWISDQAEVAATTQEEMHLLKPAAMHHAKTAQN